MASVGVGVGFGFAPSAGPEPPGTGFTPSSGSSWTAGTAGRWTARRWTTGRWASRTSGGPCSARRHECDASSTSRASPTTSGAHAPAIGGTGTTTSRARPTTSGAHAPAVGVAGTTASRASTSTSDAHAPTNGGAGSTTRGTSASTSGGGDGWRPQLWLRRSESADASRSAGRCPAAAEDGRSTGAQDGRPATTDG